MQKTGTQINAQKMRLESGWSASFFSSVFSLSSERELTPTIELIPFGASKCWKRTCKQQQKSTHIERFFLTCTQQLTSNSMIAFALQLWKIDGYMHFIHVPNPNLNVFHGVLRLDALELKMIFIWFLQTKVWNGIRPLLVCKSKFILTNRCQSTI